MKKLIILLLWAFPAFATITIHDAYTPTSTNPAGVFSQTFGTYSSAVTGDTVFCTASARGTSLQVVSLSDNVNGGYSSEVTQVASTDNYSIGLFKKANVTSGTYTFTVSATQSSTLFGLACWSVTGLGTAPVVDGTPISNFYPTACGGSTITSCNITPTNNGALVVGFFMEANTATKACSEVTSPWVSGDCAGHTAVNQPFIVARVQATAAAIAVTATADGNYWDAGVTAYDVHSAAAVASGGKAIIF